MAVQVTFVISGRDAEATVEDIRESIEAGFSTGRESISVGNMMIFDVDPDKTTVEEVRTRV